MIVRTTSGEVEGREKEGVWLFAGIPYAAPPVGGERLRPPEPAASWEGVRSAARFGPACPQLPAQGLTQGPPVRADEDCLSLNVSTPGVDGAKRPVFFWIHGGAFRNGQGAVPWYNGTSFAKRGDIVTVSINYRLGAFGFSHVPGLGPGYESSGLCGILDQICALEWVRDNIAAFGGDPSRVTIGGESAGAMSVGTILGCPRAAGLYHRAILQSGAAANVYAEDAGVRVGELFLEELGVTLAEELPLRSVEEMLKAQGRVEENRAALPAGMSGMAFRPVIDGRELPRAPLDHVKSGALAHVPMLIGTNADEMTLFGVNTTAEQLRALVELYLSRPDEAERLYREAYPDPRQAGIALLTDQVFRIPAVQLAEAHAQHGGRNYHYLFSWKSRAFGGRLGATHALEIPFVFNNLERSGVEFFLGEGPLPRDLADTMHDAWISFIRDGRPSEDPGRWPEYTSSSRKVMEFGEGGADLRDDPGKLVRELWATCAY